MFESHPPPQKKKKQLFLVNDLHFFLNIQSLEHRKKYVKFVLKLSLIY